MKNKKIIVYYLLLLGAMILRLLWMILAEPNGAKKVGLKHPNIDSIVGLIAYTLPFVVYISIAILIVIIIGVLFKKRWAYKTCFIFGIIQLLLISPIVLMRINPGYGPLIVIPACILMIIFSWLLIKNTKKIV